MAMDFEHMSTEQLKAILDGANAEVKRRKVARCDKLVQKVCDAMNALHREFPHIQLIFDRDCPECGVSYGEDVINYFCDGRDMSVHDFYFDV